TGQRRARRRDLRGVHPYSTAPPVRTSLYLSDSFDLHGFPSSTAAVAFPRRCGPGFRADGPRPSPAQREAPREGCEHPPQSRGPQRPAGTERIGPEIAAGTWRETPREAYEPAPHGSHG